ncbi:hypothetical protein R1flu_022741 [Riccia fluitans]|uniref:Uncharacterized protein n=1 Tax=Riccia fluitans TaxID=41844 RepID=A0ABD1XQ23_9MARC
MSLYVCEVTFVSDHSNSLNFSSFYVRLVLRHRGSARPEILLLPPGQEESASIRCSISKYFSSFKIKDVRRLSRSDSGKRSKTFSRRKIKPELPGMPETRAKFASDGQAREKRPILCRKALGKSLRRFSSGGLFKDYQGSEKILRREEYHQGLEVNRMVISFGL